MSKGSGKSTSGDVIYDGTGTDTMGSQASTRSTQSAPRQVYAEITPNKTRQVCGRGEERAAPVPVPMHVPVPTHGREL